MHVCDYVVNSDEFVYLYCPYQYTKVITRVSDSRQESLRESGMY